MLKVVRFPPYQGLIHSRLIHESTYKARRFEKLSDIYSDERMKRYCQCGRGIGHATSTSPN
ncbi:MAG: hypothetical protein ACKN87_07130, partial [Microcystis aeruginosa]